MARRNYKHHRRKPPSKRPRLPFVASATPHEQLIDDKVHVFVDDQNLFYGILNQRDDKSYRIDFGDLLRIAATSSANKLARQVGSAYIAGVIPDDDSFWQAANDKGFTVHRGYLNAGGRSKQDDAYLITFIMKTLYEELGPSTIVLFAGDANYFPPLEQCREKGWRVEIAFSNVGGGISNRLANVVHELRAFAPEEIERLL